MKKKKCIEGLKMPYQSPRTKMIELMSAVFMLPESWNAGHGEGNISIIEDDPTGDGKGIKERGYGEIENSLW